jgi:hypothetical protein
MSLSTLPYTELTALTDALVGSEVSTNQQTRLDALYNLAVKRAIGQSQWWPRLLVVSEPRSVLRGKVDSVEDGFQVYGAGTDAANGLYVSNGSINGKVAYRLFDSDGSTELYNVQWDNSSDWELIDGNTASVLYSITDTSATPPLEGWSVSTGTSPAPLLVDLGVIDVYLGIHPYNPFTDRTCAPISFHKQGSDVVLHTNQDLSTVYVSYKKKQTDRYGDGTGGTVSDIPEEWFNYMANYAARIFQMGEMRDNASFGLTISDREVQECLVDELMKIEEQGFDNVSKRITTHLISDNTIY